VGRTSTYGLRKWENAGLYKGGTIRKIVKEYLENWNIPKHINDITHHVLQFRDTNSYSILQNVKLMNTDKSPFVFYRGGMIGLKRKNYFKKNDLNIEPISLEELINDFF